MTLIWITEGQAIKIAGSKRRLAEELKRQSLRGDEIVLYTFAKLYHYAGKWYIHSYAQNESDARDVLVEVDKGGMCFLHGQKPFIIRGDLKVAA